MDGNKNANNNLNNTTATEQVFPNSDNENKI